MDDFQNNGFDENKQPSNDTYYNPPQENENNTTYHYAYAKPENSAENSEPTSEQNNTPYGEQSNAQSNTGSSYSQPDQPFYQESYSQNFTEATENEAEKKPKKKNGVAKAIIIVLVVCLVIAVVGMIFSATGLISSSNKTDEDNSITSEVEGSVTTNDSNAVATVDNDGNYTVAGVYENVVDSCVGITVYSQQTSAYNYFYGYGSSSSSSEPVKSSEGSGVIMSEGNGKTYILTAAHVISSGDSFTVTLNDGTELEATSVGYDAQTDIGVLSVDKTGLQVAEFANSDQLVIGEQVVAIGCPGGLEFMNSLTSGYISALDRPISSSIGYNRSCIQVDASINPGNSGGALFNMQGQVIGIVSSKIAATEYEGMSFSVPSNTAASTANSLIKVGYVEGRAKIGINYQVITSYNNSSAIISALAEKGFEDAEGTMVINSVNDDSDLVNKDIKQYDMIVAINGTTLTSTDIVTSTLSEHSPGDTVTLTIARIDGNEIKTFDIECTLIESKG